MSLPFANFDIKVIPNASKRLSIAGAKITVPRTAIGENENSGAKWRESFIPRKENACTANQYRISEGTPAIGVATAQVYKTVLLPREYFSIFLKRENSIIDLKYIEIDQANLKFCKEFPAMLHSSLA